MRLLRPEVDEVRDVGFSALAFSPNGRTLVAAFERKGLHIWDVSSDDSALLLGLDTYIRPQTIHFSPDSETVFWLGSASREATDRITGNSVVRGPFANGPTYWTAQTPDDQRVWTLQGMWNEQQLVGWRLDAGSWVREWTAAAPLDAIHQTFALDRSGKWMANLSARPIQRAGSEFHRVAIRDARTGGEVSSGRFPYTAPSQSRLLFSPDGTTLVGINKMTLLVWPIPKGGVPKRVRHDNLQHFTAATFHPSGRLLFTTNNDTTVIVWDTATWQQSTRYQWQIGQLKAVAVSADGMLAAAGAADGTIIVWDVDL